jgi:transcriptional regulator SbtR-like protein
LLLFELDRAATAAGCPAAFTCIVVDATGKKMLVDALADVGVDLEADVGDLKREMVDAIEVLLVRARRADAVRDDLAVPELLALLTAACLAAERSQWDERMRTRALALMFDGFRPRS